MNNPLFSIIIPVYNGLQNGLERCLNSIWNQQVQSDQYEVICIDDCSPNKTTLYWLESQTQLHPNLSIIRHTINKRQGGARNSGIREAVGKYIVFIDQDDYYDKDAFPKIVNTLSSNNLDLLIVDATYERPGCYNTKLQHNFPHRNIMTGDEQIVKNSIPFAPWKFIFKKQLIIENNLWFNENERIEDIDWVHRLTHYARTALYQPILFIHYQKTDTSTTMTSYKSKDTMYSTVRCGLRLLESIGHEFSCSNRETQEKVIQTGNFIVNLGLRNYLFCKDNSTVKTQQLHDIKNNPYVKSTSWISDFALKYPHFFCITSNMISCCSPHFLMLYRKYKYKFRKSSF